MTASPSPNQERDAFNYQLLGRLQHDCDHYLSFGNRDKKRLWAGDEAEQISKMKELYAELSEKPEWITLEDIGRYEAAMVGGEFLAVTAALEGAPSAGDTEPRPRG